MEDKTIQKARVSGDILLANRQPLDKLELSVTGCSLQEAQAAVQIASIPEGMRESLFRLLKKLDQEAYDISSSRRKEKEL